MDLLLLTTDWLSRLKAQWFISCKHFLSSDLNFSLTYSLLTSIYSAKNIPPLSISFIISPYITLSVLTIFSLFTHSLSLYSDLYVSTFSLFIHLLSLTRVASVLLTLSLYLKSYMVYPLSLYLTLYLFYLLSIFILRSLFAANTLHYSLFIYSLFTSLFLCITHSLILLLCICFT